jgi:hypothetical protein
MNLSQVVNKINRLIRETGLKKSSTTFRMPSDEVLKEASEKVKLLDGYNKKLVPNSEYYTKSKFVERDYVETYVKNVVDSSGNIVMGVKTLSQCQSSNTIDTYIIKKTSNRMTFVCHRLTDSYFPHYFKW